MWKRILCLFMCVMFAFLTVGTINTCAEEKPTEMFQGVSSESEIEENTFSNEAPEMINVTSGSVWLESGKQYRFVHDSFEIISIYSFNTMISVQADLSIMAHETGTTSLTLLY